MLCSYFPHVNVGHKPEAITPSSIPTHWHWYIPIEIKRFIALTTAVVVLVVIVVTVKETKVEEINQPWEVRDSVIYQCYGSHRVWICP